MESRHTKKELEIRRLRFGIMKAKALLESTDYKALKFMEGELSEEEFAPIKAQRKEARKTINELEAELEKLK